MKSWRTTGAGIAGILTILASCIKAVIDNDPNTNIDFVATGTELALCWGLIMARDNKVSSEQAGVKLAPWTLLLALGLVLLGSGGCVTNRAQDIFQHLKDDHATIDVSIATPWGTQTIHRSNPYPPGYVSPLPPGVTNAAPLQDALLRARLQQVLDGK